MGSDSAGGAHSEVRGIVHELADLKEVEEDGGVNWSWTRGIVVVVCKAFEDFRR